MYNPLNSKSWLTFPNAVAMGSRHPTCFGARLGYLTPCGRKLGICIDEVPRGCDGREAAVTAGAEALVQTLVVWMSQGEKNKSRCSSTSRCEGVDLRTDAINIGWEEKGGQRVSKRPSLQLRCALLGPEEPVQSLDAQGAKMQEYLALVWFSPTHMVPFSRKMSRLWRFWELLSFTPKSPLFFTPAPLLLVV